MSKLLSLHTWQYPGITATLLIVEGNGSTLELG